MNPSKEQLNRFIAMKVLGWESYSKVSIHPEWFSNDGCEGLVGEEDFFNPEGLTMLLEACAKLESSGKIDEIKIIRRQDSWRCIIYNSLNLNTKKHGLGLHQNFDRALFTALYHAFGGE